MAIRSTLFILFSFTISACAQITEEVNNRFDSDNNEKLSFNIDEFRNYDLPTTSISQFIFSPINQTDIIWAGKYELDLRTGGWIQLSNRFGKEYKIPTNGKGIWKDEFSSYIYFSCFHNGVLEYNTRIDSFRIINLRTVTAFYAQKDFIYFGSSNGLHKYFRDTQTLECVDQIPNKTWVYNIEKLTEDNYRLRTNNNDIIYFPDSNNIIETRTIKSRSENENNDYYVKQLPKNGYGRYYVIEDDSLDWMYNQGDLYFQSEKRIFHYTKLDSGKLRQIKADDNYLYLLFEDKFEVLNKKYVIKNSNIFDSKSYNVALQRFFDFKLNYEKLTLDELIAKIESFQKYTDSSHPNIVERLANLNSRVGNSIYSHDHLRRQVEKSIVDDSLPNKYKESALICLIQYYTVRAELNKSISYLNNLNNSFPNNLSLNYVEPCISSVKSSIDSIVNSNFDQDKVIYLTALERQKLIECTNWFGESYVEDSIVYNLYVKILKDFPKSEYADNAAFKIMHHGYYWDYEGENDELTENIKAYEKFILNYKNSELKIDVMLELANTYLIASKYTAEDLKMLEKALTILSKLDNMNLTKKQTEKLSQTKTKADSRID